MAKHLEGPEWTAIRDQLVAELRDVFDAHGLDSQDPDMLSSWLLGAEWSKVRMEHVCEEWAEQLSDEKRVPMHEVVRVNKHLLMLAVDVAHEAEEAWLSG